MRITLLSCILLLPLAVQAQRVEPIPGVLYVKFESHAAATNAPVAPMLDVQQLERAFPQLDALAAKRPLPETASGLQRLYRLTYARGVDPQMAARLVSRQPGVEYAEPWYPKRPTAVPSGIRTPPAVPDDPLFVDENYMLRMRMTDAWDVAKGEDSTVVIAIVDGGTYWQHEDLRSNVWTNPQEVDGNGFDDDGNGFADDVHGWNFANDTPDANGLSDQSYNHRHGTLVAGIAAAVSNNAIGMAGTSWNAKFMPINVACSDSDQLFCYTWEGMLYAAANGADVITASFAGYERSQTEADLMAALEQMGALVVAGAGNEGINMRLFRFYPAAFQTTLSACGTGLIADVNIFNYGYTVDVCAAARNILGTIPGDLYDTWSGTSFSVPQIAGIAALVKTVFPTFTPAQVREQLRATADNIDLLHSPEYAGLLGRGRVNAYRAVTEANAKSVRLTDWSLKDADGNGYIEVGELVQVNGTLTNLLADVGGLTIEWSADSPHIIFESGRTTSTGPLASGASHTFSFSFRTTADLAYKSLLFITPQVTTAIGTVVSGSDAIRLIGRDAQVATHETANLFFDMTSDGNIGYVDFGWVAGTDYPGLTGAGFWLQNGWATHEAGLIVGTSPTQVSGSVLETWEGYYQNTDFAPTGPLEFSSSISGVQHSRVTLSDSASASPIGLRITQHAIVDPLATYQDIVLLRYDLINPTDTAKKDVHVGLYFNWALAEWWENEVGFDTQEQILYTRHASSQPHQLYMGTVLLTPGVPIHTRSYSWEETVYLREPTHLWDGLTGGVTSPGTEVDNWAQLLGAGPISIAPWDTVSLDFALVHAQSLPSLRTNAQTARQLLQRTWGLPPRMQLVQTVADTDIDVYLDGMLLLDDWSFPSATALAPMAEGDHRLEIVAATATDNNSPLITMNFRFKTGTVNHVMVYGADANPHILSVEDVPVINATADSVNVYAAHGAEAVGTVTLRLLRSDANGTEEAVLAENLAFGYHGAFQRVKAGIHHLELTEHGSGDVLEVFGIDFQGLGGQSVLLALAGSGTSAAAGLTALAVLPGGDIRLPISTDVSAPALPLSLELHGSFPNPFAHQTNILFDLPAAATVMVTVYDLLGRTVMAGIPEWRQAGPRQTVTILGRGLSSGLYFYRLKAARSNQVDIRYGMLTRVQ